MRSRTTTHLVALGLSGAVLALAATPSSAAHQRVHHRVPARAVETMEQGPFASGEGYMDSNQAGYKGMRSSAGCWVETDLGRNFGYWGSCGDQGKALGAATGQFRTRNELVPPR